MELKQIEVLIAAFVIPGGALALYRREILEAINNLRGGGPRTPSHPLPANDASLLLRRRRRAGQPR
jgi:hypothetical protein